MSFFDPIIHSIIPHPKHRNIPHLLRKEFVMGLSILVVVLFFVNQNNFAIIRGLNLTGAIYPAVLADMTNSDRGNAGVGALAWSSTLENAARLKAEDMIANSYFAHTSPAGVTPWHWLEKVKYNFIYAGENLALDFSESKTVQDAWLNSPSHRENLLNQNYTELGITALDGTYEGRNTTFVVEFFGKPLPKVIEKTKTTTQTKITTTTKPAATAKVAELKPEVAGASTTQNTVPADTKYSTWYMRFAMSPTNTIKGIYELIFGLVLLSSMLVLKNEYKKHHTKHLAMGLMLVTLTIVLFYILKEPALVQAFF